jgi:hypothetical protein
MAIAASGCCFGVKDGVNHKRVRGSAARGPRCEDRRRRELAARYESCPRCATQQMSTEHRLRPRPAVDRPSLSSIHGRRPDPPRECLCHKAGFFSCGPHRNPYSPRPSSWSKGKRWSAPGTTGQSSRPVTSTRRRIASGFGSTSSPKATGPECLHRDLQRQVARRVPPVSSRRARCLRHGGRTSTESDPIPI